MPAESRPLPPAGELWDRYSYNPLTGELFSRKRPNWRKPLGRSAGRKGYTLVKLKWCGLETGAHRVIWKWCTGTEPSATIDHINRDRSDNRIWNLRKADQLLQNRNHTGCKLTKTDVRDIKAKLEQGVCLRVLAEKYGVWKQTIHAISTGKTWGDVA